MRFNALIGATLVAAVFTVSAAPAAYAQSNESNKDKPQIVTIDRGDTLSAIAKDNETTYQRLFNKNTDIKHPDVIFPGDELTVPDEDEKLERRELPSDAVAPAAAPAPAPAAQPATEPAPQRAAPAVSEPAVAPSGGVWDRLAQCESGGNWAINTGNGFYGGLQFSLSSWQAVGGSGLPSDASKSEQIARAKQLQAIQGWGAWPACTAKLGIR